MQDTGVLVYCMRSFAALQGSKVPDRKPRDRVLLLAGDLRNEKPAVLAPPEAARQTQAEATPTLVTAEHQAGAAAARAHPEPAERRDRVLEAGLRVLDGVPDEVLRALRLLLALADVPQHLLGRQQLVGVGKGERPVVRLLGDAEIHGRDVVIHVLDAGTRNKRLQDAGGRHQASAKRLRQRLLIPDVPLHLGRREVARQLPDCRACELGPLINRVLHFRSP